MSAAGLIFAVRYGSLIPLGAGRDGFEFDKPLAITIAAHGAEKRIIHGEFERRCRCTGIYSSP